MVTMSSNWDRTTAVLSGRSAILARIAIPAFFLPAVVRDGWTALTGAASPTLVAIGGLIGIVALLVTIWGQLAIVAVASDPATTLGDAAGQATRRFGAALGVYLIAGVALVVVLLPVVFALAGADIDFAAMSLGQPPRIAPGIAGFVGLYFLVLVVVGIIVAARLFLLNPVIVNEKGGLGAFSRAWSLTRGLTWRIIGVTLLFLIVYGIAASAAQFITGIVFRLILGPNAIAGATFAAAVAGAVVTAIYIVVTSVFSAQLYEAVSGRRVADTFA